MSTREPAPGRSSRESEAGGAAGAARPDDVHQGDERAAQDGRHESEHERLDRNTIELVQEMRVGAVGIQVLFAFLLVVPFNTGWKRITSFDRHVYYATLACVAIATVLLVALPVQHRILFRHDQKPYLVSTGNRLMLIAMVFQAAALVGILVLISHVVFGAALAVVAGVLTAVLTGGLWFGMPLAHLAKVRAGARRPDRRP